MLLNAQDVVSGYGDAIIIQGADLQVDDGEMVTIIGPNGAGKSTLMKTIVGFLECREGSITFNGEDITNMKPDDTIDYGLCYVPQNDNVFPNLTVMENLRMGAWTIDEEVFEKRVQNVYDRFPVLEERTGQLVGSMSGGQQQMVAMGSALMLDPDLLLLDEPSAGLAPQLIDETFDRIARINDEGTAILMVEQNARRALRESDRGIVLDQGVDRFEGTGESLLNDEEVIDLYLGVAGEDLEAPDAE
jgi:branched-chain amino acid transport system ATP-binding protein